MQALLSSSPSVTDSVKPTESPPWQQGVLAFTDRLSVGALIEVTEADRFLRRMRGLPRQLQRIKVGKPCASAAFPYKEKKTGVIITGSEVYNGRREERFEPVVRKKLEYYPGQILDIKICDDDMDMIMDAASDLLKRGADFLIFTGGMSVDPDDLTPGAIKRLGADIISYGLPAQPGNMTLVAYLDGATVLGVPGAAISLPTTMFDVLLPQIYADVRFTKQDIVRLAQGGLCQMCKTCHYPNCTFGRY